MKNSTRRFIKILGIALASVTVVVLFCFLFIEIPWMFSYNFKKNNTLLITQGPWNQNPSIWVSEDENLYLYVSETPEPDGKIYGYIKTQTGEWESCTLQKKNNPGVRLTFRNGLILEAEAKMKDGDLVLSKIEFAAVDTFPEWETLTLRSYSVEEKIDEYPVPPQLD